MRFIVIDVNLNNSDELEDILYRNHNHFGAIYDTSCENSLKYFKKQVNEL